MRKQARTLRRRKARFLTSVEKQYRTALKDPKRLLTFSLGGIVIVVLGASVLFVFAPEENAWTVFDHVTALLGGVGLLLALPALGYAARTDTVARYIYANLTKERDLPARPPDQREQTLAEPVAQLGIDDVQVEGGDHPTTVDEMLEQEPGIAPLARWLAPESSEILVTPSQISNALSRFALETAIEASGEREHVRDLIVSSQVFTLGERVGDDESDLLHFEIEEDDGRDVVMLPVFTNWKIIHDARLRNPDWGSLGVLEVSGGKVIDNRDSDVALVVNPWSDSAEFQLPPSVG